MSSMKHGFAAGSLYNWFIVNYLTELGTEGGYDYGMSKVAKIPAGTKLDRLRYR